MPLPIAPPLSPMLARLARELPIGDFFYEPKWDGFRALVFRDGGTVDIRSRHDSRLSRYFPELVQAFLAMPRDGFVIDGEILVTAAGAFDFAALMSRLHPARSRVERLSLETPAAFVAFDLLALDDVDLRAIAFAERRAHLETLLAAPPAPLSATAATRDPGAATAWLSGASGTGIEGVVAKAVTLTYQPGKRAMVKVKRERTADCVVAGIRMLADRPNALGSLLLGVHDDRGSLRHVGIASSFARPVRAQLLEEIAPMITSIAGHPWERGFGLGRSPVGRLAGAAGRWDPAEMSLDWLPVRPERVCEVAYEVLDAGRFRHPARFRRWRPDREPSSCTFAQFELDRRSADASGIQA